MSSPNPLIAPTRNAVTIQLQGQEADKIVLYVTGTWGVGEDAAVNLPTTNAGLTPYFDAASGSAITVGNANSSFVLEGGMLYTIVKPATASDAGLDYQLKPRQGS